MTDACRVPQPPNPEYTRLVQAMAQMAHGVHTTALTLRAALAQTARAAQVFAAVWQPDARPWMESQGRPDTARGAGHAPA